MKVRAKMKVEAITQREHGFEVTLRPVTGGSPENDEFYKWTPAGQCVLATVPASVAGQFLVGEFKYVDFSDADG